MSNKYSMQELVKVDAGTKTDDWIKLISLSYIFPNKYIYL